MADEPALLYLEPDDEITAVVRRIREADAAGVVLVAPGRSKATSSTVALRLLAGVAADEGREVAIVGDALTRSLAEEAGLTSYVSVDDARRAAPAPPGGSRSAAIHVVRGEEPSGPAPAAAVASPGGPSDETRAVPIPRPGPAKPARRAQRRPASRRRGRADVALVAVLVGVLLLAGGGVAAVLPSARVTIAPATQPLGPVSYELPFEDPQAAASTAEETVTHSVAGTYHDLEPAVGGIVLYNWNISTAVEVPAGTQVASTVAAFGTVETVVVPRGQLISFNPPAIRAGQAEVGVTAIDPGPAGNVVAGEIDTVLDEERAAELRGLPDNPERLVTNPEPTAGGLDESGPLVEEADVDAAVEELRTLLADEVATVLAPSDGAVIADAAAESEPTIAVPDDLVGKRDVEEFELTGSQTYDRAWVPIEEVEAAARARMTADAEIVPVGRELIEGSELVTVDATRRDGGAVVATVSVTVQTVATVDEEELAGRIAGMTFADARAELAALGGAVEISGWPEWVDALPRLSWRIEIDVNAPEPSPSPQPS